MILVRPENAVWGLHEEGGDPPHRGHNVLSNAQIRYHRAERRVDNPRLSLHNVRIVVDGVRHFKALFFRDDSNLYSFMTIASYCIVKRVTLKLVSDRFCQTRLTKR